MDSGRIEEGVKVLLKGAKMYPHDFQCLTNVAGALRYVSFHIQSLKCRCVHSHLQNEKSPAAAVAFELGDIFWRLHLQTVR